MTKWPQNIENFQLILAFCCQKLAVNVYSVTYGEFFNGTDPYGAFSDSKKLPICSQMSMASEFRLSAPLVVGEDIFMEEPDNDNESEWSLEIK